MKSFFEELHCNPSKYAGEEWNLYAFVKYCGKRINQGLLKEDWMEAFKRLLDLAEQYKRVNHRN